MPNKKPSERIREIAHEIALKSLPSAGVLRELMLPQYEVAVMPEAIIQYLDEQEE